MPYPRSGLVQFLRRARVRLNDKHPDLVEQELRIHEAGVGDYECPKCKSENDYIAQGALFICFVCGYDNSRKNLK